MSLFSPGQHPLLPTMKSRDAVSGSSLFSQNGKLPAPPQPPGASNPSGLPSRPPSRGSGLAASGRGPVGASASPWPGPASMPPFPGRRRSSYPQDVIAFRTPARDLNALRRAHGGGRSVWPDRALRSSPPPRVPPAPFLRVALGTWHSQPRESRAALPAGRSSPRQPGPRNAADSATCREPLGGA